MLCSGKQTAETALPSRLGRLHWRPFIKRAKRTVCSLRFLKHEPSALCACVSREGTQARCCHVLRNYMIIRANRWTAASFHPVLLRSSGVHAFQLRYGLTSSLMGSGDSSVVRAPDSWLKSRGFESLVQERRENFLLQGRLSVLTLLFRYPFHPRVTAVARKRPRSFCPKCRWQVTAKRACPLRMWLCMK